MAINFPEGIDSFSDNTDSVDDVVAQDINDLNDAVEALEAKVGINSSAVATSLDYLVKNASSSDPGHKHTLAAITGMAGIMTPYAGSSAPTGWLICDGSAVSRTTYATLFGVVGTTYGTGDGSTTFNLPNLKGKIIVGLNGTDTSFDSLGETGGAKTATLTTTELPAHTHTGTVDSNGAHTHTVTGNTAGGSGGVRIDASDSFTETTSSNGAHTHTFTTASSGSGTAFSIMNPYITLYYIIKT